MVAAQHAEPARVDGKALVQPELGGEVRDAEALVLAGAVPPRLAVELGGRRRERLLDARDVVRRQRRSEILVGELGEERRRVVVKRRETFGIQVVEERPRGGQPAEREVARDRAERLAQRGGTVDRVDVRASG